MDDPILLIVDGAVEERLALRYADLEALPVQYHVLDVSRFHPKRQGDGVALESLLERAQPRPDANYLTLHADRDDFHVSVPLDAVRGQAVVVYKQGENRLEAAQGGPVRLIIKDPTACHSSELDECANVKYLSRIELTVQKGRDTRPADDASHTALHNGQKKAIDLE